MRSWWLAGIIALFSAIWSSAFVAGKIAMYDADAFTVLIIRFVIAALCLGFYLVITRTAWESQAVYYGFVLGILNNCFYLGSTFFALNFISAAQVTVIVSCAPFITLMLSAWMGLEAPNLRQFVGIAIGLLGVGAITGISVADSVDWRGIGWAFGGTFAFSIATILFRNRAQSLPITQMNFWQSLAGILGLAPIAVLLGKPLHTLALPAELAIVYLAVVVTIGGMSLWLFLIRTSGASVASSYHLLNPIFGLLLSAMILGATLAPKDFVGAAAITVGLYLTHRSYPPKGL